MALFRFGVSHRLMLLVATAILGFVALAAYALNERHDGMIADRVAKLRSIVQISAGLAESLEKDVAAGGLSREAAVAEFRKRLTGMRFDGDNFVAVYDWTGTNLVQPIKPEFVGRNMIGLKDPSGTPLVQRWIEIAKSGTPQTMLYSFVKPGQDVPQPKLGYVQGFAPWQIVILSGIHIDDIDAAYWSHAARLALIAGGAILVVGLVGLSCWRSIAGGLAGLTVVTADLARGDYDRTVPGTRRRDEIGAIARTVEDFRLGLIERRALSADQDRSREAQALRATTIQAAASAFEARVLDVLGGVDTAARGLHATAQGMSATAAATADQTSGVAAAAEQASGNVTMVSAAAEELGSSVVEIGRQVRESAELAHLAVGEAGETARIVRDLSEAASKIGDMVAMISGVAGQTNLLALNATIEAARAGEAGRGFAVVASEVKALAGQTAKAAEEITAQIASIQSSTGRTVAAIAAITGRVREISAVSSTVAEAVDGQAAATQEIVHNMNQAAAGTGEVGANVSGLVGAAASTGEAAVQVLSAAADLSRRSESIGAEVRRFLHAMQAA